MAKSKLALRGAGLAAAAVAAVTLIGAGAAFAFNSGDNPGTTGPNTITWTGQGATNGAPKTILCDEKNDPFGLDQPYLLWILTVDGGSITNDSSTPVLHLGGTGSGDYTTTNPSDNSAAHFVTPYFTPNNSLTASADIDVVTTGRGAWNLVISHGCPGNAPQASPPSISKDAAGAYTTTWTWGIDKSVDNTEVKQVGGTATFNYTVTVTHDSGINSNVTVSGTIHVNNPNGAAVTLSALTDQLSDGTNCTVTVGSTSLAPGDNTFPYTCSLGALPSGPIDNTATVTWENQTLSDESILPAGDTDSTVSNISFTQTKVDDMVTVTDSYAGSLGTAVATDPSPKSFTYSRLVNVPQFGCQTYNNTATFTTNTTGTIGHDYQTVRVCGPVQTGALTMGFWQNKNGQAIITTGANTGGVCNSGTWLRSYASFADLGATATCSQVATYVTNVIKAANASGSSMNAMLKAQMLATALDVYFSDPVLGGNKIGAPAPVGGVTIDLTKVCANPVTCTIYENTSGAFGGASSLTVSQLLTYAAGQSNTGGSNWYGQIKATQQLAKDTFDAINNQVAFGA
jgi:hypothetical protein